MFFSDGRSMIDATRRACDAFERGASGRRTVDSAFRSVHSLKSEASFLGFRDVAERAHALEEVFVRLRRSSEQPDGAALSRLRSLVDRLDESFTAAVSAAPDGLPEGTRRVRDDSEKQFSDFLATIGPFERTLLGDARSRGERAYGVSFTITETAEMVGPRLYLALFNLESTVNVVANYPGGSTNGARAGDAAGAGDGTPEVYRDHQTVHVLFTTTRDPADVVAAIHVDQIADIRIVALRYDELVQTAIDRDFRSGILAGAETVDVTMSARKFEALCVYSEELLRLSRELTATNKTGVASRLLTLSAALEETVHDTSTTTIHDVFEALREPAENVISHSGKSVQLVFDGGPHAVYRPVAEVLIDALMHVIRNAIDHGIEETDTRRRRGKEAAGTIKITGEQIGATYVIRVRDDGSGLPREILSKSQDPYELFDFLAAPGFTTVDASRTTSGRGVGLDAVRHAIFDLLGGHVSVKSKPGVGTVIKFEISSASRLLSVLVIRSRDTVVAVPAAFVYRTFAISDSAITEDAAGHLWCRFEDQNVRVFDPLERPIGSRDDLPGKSGLYVRMRTSQAIIVCDEIVSEETVVRDPAAPTRVYSQVVGGEVELRTPVEVFPAPRFGHRESPNRE
ncbi:MAG: hypothetical protein EA426_12930 [Spirochaetaceae bacterium]|nr:MAG: hypothetical protein EA426_12930 [Spirochaetaceae bacterium]